MVNDAASILENTGRLLNNVLERKRKTLMESSWFPDEK
jgi:hypothetical protein